jgi:ribonuclease HI
MKEVHIYTDGSHLDKQHGGRLGCGGVLVVNGKAVKTFSKELTGSYMKMMFDSDKCSNPSAELTAVYLALKEFKKEIKGVDRIIFHADFTGVREWMSGKWKIKELVIKNIKAKIDEEITSQKLDGKLSFEWVKGHQSSKDGKDTDAYWNNYVDKLAKGE